MAKKEQTNFKKYIIRFWMVVLGGFIAFLLVFLLASWGVFGELPTFEELENPEKNLATEVISSDGVTLGKYAFKNRTPVGFKDLPDNLVNALIATEDERFYEHSGIDFRGLARAIVKLGKGGGASTITQQLAKNLFNKGGSSSTVKRLTQKVKEWIVATKLERQYTKNEIVAMYLNTQGFLFNAIGIRSASRIYFGKEPKDLDIQESAILVAMLKNPRQFNPNREISKGKSLIRRNVVFAQMAKNEFITQQEKDSLQQLPLKINFTPESHNDGLATYFREYLRDYLKKWTKNNPKPNGELYNINRDGLKIYVTLDSRMQQYAQEAVQEHMSNLQSYFFKEQKNNESAPFYDLEEEQVTSIYTRARKRSERYRKMKKNGYSEKQIDSAFDAKTDMRVFSWNAQREVDTILSPNDSIQYYKTILRSGLLSIEPQTGHIKAWVGGINHKYFKYDHVEQGKRQVGSTFKPFVYATAINQLRLSPCEKFSNTPYTIPKGRFGIPKAWTPKNSGEKYGGEISLKEALAKSVNVISARLIDMVTPANVARLAKSAGIESRIPKSPSIALGSVELSLMEMTGAYATFANKGMRVEPNMLLRIEDKNGTVLADFTPKTNEVLSEESAYVVLELLKGVTTAGSGVRLRTSAHYYKDIITGFPYEFTNPIAGKTGTTQNQTDGWFMGVVPNLATGVWTGGEDRAVHFEKIAEGQGATMSLPTWALFMKKVYADTTLNISQEDFEKPEYVGIDTNCGKEPVNKIKKRPPVDDDTDF
ncbi:transglycosylase domain-containing protein [Flavobacteriaceae bacterium]|jgi:penicillin-binding protein 1A|nr:transglycosylase domain-containing protein [Flavobacteriaceae bacterium]|tara:strand:- start:1785 stop:4076 length:2292 start_codon:yes stop_codon:yes gene_type:complete